MIREVKPTRWKCVENEWGSVCEHRSHISLKFTWTLWRMCIRSQCNTVKLPRFILNVMQVLVLTWIFAVGQPSNGKGNAVAAAHGQRGLNACNKFLSEIRTNSNRLQETWISEWDKVGQQWPKSWQHDCHNRRQMHRECASVCHETAVVWCWNLCARCATAPLSTSPDALMWWHDNFWRNWPQQPKLKLKFNWRSTQGQSCVSKGSSSSQAWTTCDHSLSVTPSLILTTLAPYWMAVSFTLKHIIKMRWQPVLLCASTMPFSRSPGSGLCLHPFQRGSRPLRQHYITRYYVDAQNEWGHFILWIHWNVPENESVLEPLGSS